MKMKNVLAGIAATVALVGVAVAQPQSMGPASMEGYGSGYRLGQGMMGGGYGMGQGMGPGMMFGYTNEAYAGLDITPEQQKSIASIHEQAYKAMWPLMGTMHGQGYHMQGMFGPGPVDEAAARKSFQTMAETQKAMFELQLDARKKIDTVLKKDQREKLSRYWSSR
jgi:Spy/CpxP family protein refolding chaperone